MGLFSKSGPPAVPPARFPPVPAWQPKFAPPLDRIAERVRHYTDNSRDFVLLEHGTCVILENGLSDQPAVAFAQETLHGILHAHPDLTPVAMKDGNVLVRYRLPAVNLVFADVAEELRAEIERLHLEALTPGEVLVTPLGPNVFDDFGKRALFGRCFMFMDAQDPKIVRIERKGA